jgi:RNA polymerase sigma-70 factor, ECF subfamily
VKFSRETTKGVKYGAQAIAFLLGMGMKLEPGNNHTPLAIDFSEYLDALYSYAVVLSRNRTESEDLVQETCLRALRAVQTLRPDSNIKSWLFTILRNIWLNQLRQSRTTLEIADPDLGENRANGVVDTAKDAYATCISNIEHEQVRHAIEQLPLQFREIILLREYEEFSYEEIATLLCRPVGTVVSRLARARSKLRDLPLATAQGSSGTKDANAASGGQEPHPEDAIENHII